MELDQTLNLRKSIRAYLDKKVERSTIESLVAAGLKAPVSCNLQLTKFVIVDDENLIKKLSKEVSSKFSYAPCTIVVLYDRRYTVERHSAASSAAMSAQNIMLKAVELGLGTCPMAGFKKDGRIKNILQIPKYYNIALLISLGYPDPSTYKHPIPKLPIAQTFSYNNFGSMESIVESDNLEEHSPKSIADYRGRIAPVYMDRFRLHTWKGGYYGEVAKLFVEKFGIDKKIVDVMSYDGFWLKTLIEDFGYDSEQVIATDYLQTNLDFFQKKLNTVGCPIDFSNHFSCPDKADITTVIFQAALTPSIERLADSIADNLISDGKIFVAEVVTGYLRKTLKSLKRRKNKILHREVYNIYENNPFYKSGPRSEAGLEKLSTSLLARGFIAEEQGIIKKYPLAGISIVYRVFKKN